MDTKKTRVTGHYGLCAQNTDIPFQVQSVNLTGRSMRLLEEKENLHFDFLYLLHLNFELGSEL
jgi:hypothetical protein